MGVNLVAVLWGFAEATLFFIVPDVWTSWVGLKNLRRGWIACLWATCGALAGGLVMYRWGAADPGAALWAVEHVPAINRELTGRVGEALSDRGVTAILLGPLSGTPYKIYAVQAHQAGIPIAVFLLISIPARLIRFLLVTSFVHGVGRIVLAYTSFKGVSIVFAAAWLLFYVVYFWAMSG